MDRPWWWLWSHCPGLGAARIRALRSVACEWSVGPAELWSWPTHRLQTLLSWPESCWSSVERFRRLHGKTPKINVPGNVLLPGDHQWPQGVDRLDRPRFFCITVVTYRCFTANGNSRLLPLWGLGPLQPMVSQWLRIWAARWRRWAGQ